MIFKANEKMDQFKSQFEEKLEYMEEQTDQRFRKSEQIIVDKLQEMQIQNTENINKSFTMKMNEMLKASFKDKFMSVTFLIPKLML